MENLQHIISTYQKEKVKINKTLDPIKVDKLYSCRVGEKTKLGYYTGSVYNFSLYKAKSAELVEIEYKITSDSGSYYILEVDFESDVKYTLKTLLSGLESEFSDFSQNISSSTDFKMEPFIITNFSPQIEKECLKIELKSSFCVDESTQFKIIVNDSKKNILLFDSDFTGLKCLPILYIEGDFSVQVNPRAFLDK